TPGGNTLSAAEHTVCHDVFHGSTHPPGQCGTQGRHLDRKTYLGSELHGKTLAIVGLGRIGREVAKRMQAFGMITIGYDPIIPKEAAAEWGVESLPLKEVWPRADYITVHTPLLPHTRNLINDTVLASCKKGVKIVNVARGGIVDEAALLKALQSGQCGGAALDVFVEEPPTDLTLCSHPKVICTPHLGANTVEAQHRVACEMATQLADMVKGKPLVGVVNAPALTNATNESLKPWIELAQALGCLAKHLTQLNKENTTPIKVCLDLYGDDMDRMKDLVGPAVLVGMLRGMTPNGINMVNAPLLAKERDITLSLTSHSHQMPPVPAAAPDALQVRVVKGNSTHILLGNAASGQATLYSLDGCVWESGLTLGRNMLFFSAAPSVSPLATIATQLEDRQAAVTSLLSSAPTDKEMWHVARTEATVSLRQAIPGTRLMAQVTF
ncbi:hypothetical protein Pmani_039946, partial [Petrolisthes manimaculis]